jgi:hypothetical protein
MTMSIKTFEILSSASLHQGKETMIYQMRQGDDNERIERCYGPM